jgi:hypothetical protein
MGVDSITQSPPADQLVPQLQQRVGQCGEPAIPMPTPARSVLVRHSHEATDRESAYLMVGK